MKKTSFVLLTTLLLIGVLLTGCTSKEKNSYKEIYLDEYVKKSDINNLIIKPSKYYGKKINVTGKVTFVDKNKNYFKMLGEKENSVIGKEILLAPKKGKVDVKVGEIVNIDGHIQKKLVGENIDTVTSNSSLLIRMLKSKKISVYDLYDKAVETKEYNITKSNNDYSITLEKVEFGKNSTRVFVKYNIKWDNDFTGFKAKILEEGKDVGIAPSELSILQSGNKEEQKEVLILNKSDLNKNLKLILNPSYNSKKKGIKKETINLN